MTAPCQRLISCRTLIDDCLAASHQRPVKAQREHTFAMPHRSSTATLIAPDAEDSATLSRARFGAELVALGFLHRRVTAMAAGHGRSQLSSLHTSAVPEPSGRNASGSSRPWLRNLCEPDIRTTSANGLDECHIIVEPSFTSEPKTEAQNRASVSAAAASKQEDLISLAIFVT
jgi:hypothetical protein